MIDDEETEPHRLSVAAEYSYDHRATLLNGTDELPARGQFDITTLALDLEYRLPRQFAARLRVPVFWKTFAEADIPDVRISGPGDLECSGTYDFVRSPHWVGVVGIGVAVPTGDTSAQPVAGSAVPTPLQLGTGTFDPLVLAFGAFRPTRAADIHASADGRTVLYANGFHYQAASVYTGIVGSEYRAWAGRLAGALDLELAHTTHTTVRGSDIPNTGRDVAYVAPRIRARIFNGLYVEASLRLPIVQSVNETQFGETVETSVRLTYVSAPLLGGHHHDHDEGNRSESVAE